MFVIRVDALATTLRRGSVVPRIVVRRAMAFARLGVVAAVALSNHLGAVAQDIPWRKVRVDLRASNEPLNAFLGRMLTLGGVPATMSAPVASARVNGHLEGSAQSVFRELVDTYGLTWYYDGSMLYVYSLAEMESRMLQVQPVDLPRVERTLRDMRLLDARFPLRSSPSEGQFFVTGPPQYVRVVSDVVAGVAHAPSQSPRQADVRVFRLVHARASDTTVSIGGTETTIPGVARILNETLGASRIEVTPSATRTLPVAMTGLRGKGQAAVGRGDAALVDGRASADAAGNANVDAKATGDLDIDGRASTGPWAALPPADAQVVGTGADAAPMTPRPSSPAIASGTHVAGGPSFPPAAAGQTPQRQATDGVVRADPRINAVIVRDTQDRMPMYARLIHEMDVVTPLLEIEATVIDVSRDKSEQLGIDWRLHANRADIVSSPNGLAADSSGNLLYNLPVQSTGGPGLVGTLLFGSARTNFLARLNALTANGDANLVSKPRVLTLDNTEAVLQSTQDFYVRVAGRAQVDLFNVSLGLVLRVTPTLIEDAQGTQVKLNIRIEDGNTNSGGQVDQIPVVNRNAISTQAVVANGHSLLVGGYTIDETTRATSGVPVLSDIPGLRWLFGQKSSTARRVERIFMITPRLVRLDEARGDGGPVPSITPTPPDPTLAPLSQRSSMEAQEPPHAL